MLLFHGHLCNNYKSVVADGPEQGVTRKEYKCNISIIKNMNPSVIVHELRAGYISLIEFEIWRIQY
jgi:hypothetical protein